MSTGFEGIRPKQFITNGSLAADLTSEIIEVLPIDRVGIEVVWSASDVVGILYVQGTITGDRYANLRNPDGSLIRCTITGTTNYFMFDVDVKAFSRIRMFFDYTSGTAGTLNGYYLAKGKYI